MPRERDAFPPTPREWASLAGGPFVLDDARYLAAASAGLHPALREPVKRAIG
jgi:hypothetical protein